MNSKNKKINKDNKNKIKKIVKKEQKKTKKMVKTNKITKTNIKQKVNCKKANKKLGRDLNKNKNFTQDFSNLLELEENYTIEKNEKNFISQKNREKKEKVKRLKAANKNIKTSVLENFPNIKVIGIGGAGGNILSRMKQARIEGVEFIVVNTDLQDLYKSGIKRRIHIGKNISKGMGSGMNPEIGRQAAEESREQLEEAVKGADMVFLACGLGGGTGSGATPIIAEICQQLGILTIAIVTKPFAFEGSKRAQIAEEALLKLKDKVDSYIVIPNDRIFNIIEQNTPLSEAFEKIDEILKQSVKGISDLILLPGIINVDFSDVKAILENSGMSLIGLAKATGEDRSIKAAREALSSPLFEYSPHMARGILFNIIGDSSLTMTEINEAARIITEVVDPSAKIIFGAMEDSKMKKGEIKIMVIAAGFDYSSKNVNRLQFSSFDKERNLNKRPYESLDNSADLTKDDSIKISINEEINNNEIDHALEEIPAFLRKKKNK